ncbi:MAG TPA: hypothetical protein VG123_33305, partial [Streptosporangiaceae bacterium]|nr:hypothetical protein [Streptosporangiaceae bacterium]
VEFKLVQESVIPGWGAHRVSPGGRDGTIGMAVGVALFSFIGVEVAAITAKQVKNPQVSVAAPPSSGSTANPSGTCAAGAPKRRLVPAARLDELLGRAAAVGVGVGHGAAQFLDG